MIFLTVGSQKFQFNRLLKKVDQLIEEHMITEEVFAQTGSSDYVPQSYAHRAFYGREEFAGMVDRCSIVITHGGAGTMIEALKRGKRVVAVPRLAQYGEHVDDHQLQLMEQFKAMNLICACPDMERLPEALREVREHQYDGYVSNTEAILRSIDRFIQENVS